MAKKEEKGKEQIKKKMELESKKLRLQLAQMTAKAKKGQKMFNPWERDSNEWMHLSFIPDNDSKGDVEIYVNKCFKYNEEFDQMTKRCTDVTTALVEFIIDVCQLLCWQLPKSRAKTWLT